MQDKEPKKKEEKVFDPFSVIVLPCFIVFLLYKAFGRFYSRDFDSGLMYSMAALLVAVAIYSFTRKKK